MNFLALKITELANYISTNYNEFYNNNRKKIRKSNIIIKTCIIFIGYLSMFLVLIELMNIIHNDPNYNCIFTIALIIILIIETPLVILIISTYIYKLVKFILYIKYKKNNDNSTENQIETV